MAKKGRESDLGMNVSADGDDEKTNATGDCLR